MFQRIRLVKQLTPPRVLLPYAPRTWVWLLWGSESSYSLNVSIKHICVNYVNFYFMPTHPSEPILSHWPPVCMRAVLPQRDRLRKITTPPEDAWFSSLMYKPEEPEKGIRDAGIPAKVPNLFAEKFLRQNSFLKKRFIAAIRHSCV